MNMAAGFTANGLIPIRLVNGGEEELNTCVYVGWYRFKRCGIKTCKNYTSRTENGCLALDRQAPIGNKIISDSELNLFKFHEDGISTRAASQKRKKAVNRVKGILALRGYIEHIHQKYRISLNSELRFTDPLLLGARKVYPLKVKRLGFKNWMWPLLLNEREYKAFAEKKGGEIAQIALHELLDVTPQRLEEYRAVAIAKFGAEN